jgi:ATP-dependent RNA helicase DDX49/DBP8
MDLFARKRTRPRSPPLAGSSIHGGSGGGGGAASGIAAPRAPHPIGRGGATTFSSLGLPPWLCSAALAMGLHKPTPIQSFCVPAVLRGTRNVLGVAETGSGKTAAFALPVLARLGADPWGIAALVLTPSRELAFQIGEQFSAFGAGMGVRVAVVTGGGSLVGQAAALDALPHVVVATPGRLAYLLTNGASPPNLSRLAFLVLDEVDRLGDESMAPDVGTVLGAALRGGGAGVQVMCFSATAGAAAVAAVPALRARGSPEVFNCGGSGGGGDGGGGGDRDGRVEDLPAPPPKLPARLTQEYLFIPEAVKNAYLVHLLLTMGPVTLEEGSGGGSKAPPAASAAAARKKRRAAAAAAAAAPPSSASAAATADGKAPSANPPRARSLIVFASTCAAAQGISELCKELALPCAALHSVMPQAARLGAIAKFKGGLVPVLVATDVASRGLDLPCVDLVINYDVPRAPADYVHRVGRTARVGRAGRAVTLVTQYEVALLQAIEARALGGEKLAALPPHLAAEREVLVRLSKVATALEVAKMRLEETGFNERLDDATERKREAREGRRAAREGAAS